MTYMNRARGIAASLVVLSAISVVPRAEVIEQVLVKVNGEIFTKTELEARQVAARLGVGAAGHERGLRTPDPAAGL